MLPFDKGASLEHVIQSALPAFTADDYPLFVEFVQAFARFLEQTRTTEPVAITPVIGPAQTIDQTVEPGGPFYEMRNLLAYRDADSTIDDFVGQFMGMFARHFPHYTYLPLPLLIQSLRQFYQSKGTQDSFKWLFTALFNQDVAVYYPRQDIFRASAGTWDAPISLKVSSPLNGVPNAQVAIVYPGQRVSTTTGTALVERVQTYVVGQQFGKNITVNELYLKTDSILGTFQAGQTLTNIDTPDVVVAVTIFPVINDVTIQSGGSNYAVGDIVVFSEGPGGGEGYGAEGVVSAVSNTALDGVSVVSGGDGYVVGDSVIFTSTTGSGASATVDGIVYGFYLDEDDTPLLNETQSGTTADLLQEEDKNTIDLGLTIDAFVNATANVVIDDSDYGIASGVVQLDGESLDSDLEQALAAADEKPFMIPWVFTNDLQTEATLANVACLVQHAANTFFANGSTVYTITDVFDLTTNLATSKIQATVIVSDTTKGANQDYLYLNAVANLNQFSVGNVLKVNGTGVTQNGTITLTAASANVVGNGTSFTTVLMPNTHIRASDGTELVVQSVVNNTFLSTFTAAANTVTNGTWSIIPVGKVTQTTFQQQVYYGEITSVKMISAGAGYVTPPAVSADSIDARAQELFHLNPDPSGNTANNQIVASSGQVVLFTSAVLKALEDTGQVSKVKITASGVAYTNPASVMITAEHEDGRTGANAQMTAVTGALTTYPGKWTTTQSFASSDKFLQSTYYNDYTYEVRVAESFDKYATILKKLLHPAGFQAVGAFHETTEAPVAVSAEDPLTTSTQLTYSEYVLSLNPVGYWRLGDTEGYAQAVLADSPVGYWRLNESESYAQAVVADGPVGYWRLGEANGTNAVNFSGAAANGIYTGNVVLGQVGALSDGTTAADFSSRSGVVSLGTDTHITGITGPFSVEAFVNLTGNTIDINYNIFNSMDFQTGGFNLRINGGIANVQFITGQTNAAVTVVSSNMGAVSLNVWHHIVGVFDGSNGNIYIDGVLAKTGVLTAPITANLNSMNASIGGSVTTSNSVSSGFDGSLDEVAIYNYALSNTQIQNHYNLRTSTSANTAALVIVDSSGNGHDGTVQKGVVMQQTGALADGNKAMMFDGVSGSIHGNTNVTLSNTITIEAWVANVGTGGAQAIFGTDGTGEVLIEANTTLIQIWPNTVSPNVISFTHSLTNSYHHLAFTYNYSSSTGMLFVDGAWVNTQVVVTSTPPIANAFYIGERRDGNRHFLGTIDEVAIYNYALSNTQIANHYRLRTSTINVTSNVAVVDISGNHYDGVIVGGVETDEPGAIVNGTGMFFDGSSGYVTLPDMSSPFQTSNTSITMIAWAKNPPEGWNFSTPNASVNTVSMLISLGSGFGDYLRIENNSNVATLVGSLELLNTQYGNIQFAPNQSNVVPSDNTYHMVALTWQAGDYIRLFLDGVQVANSNTMILGNIHPFTLENSEIGLWHAQPSLSFSRCFIDEVSVHVDALSAAQILDLYNLKSSYGNTAIDNQGGFQQDAFQSDTFQAP